MGASCGVWGAQLMIYEFKNKDKTRYSLVDTDDPQGELEAIQLYNPEVVSYKKYTPPEPTPEELKAERLAWLEEWSKKEQETIVMRKSANEIFTNYDTAIVTAREEGAAYVDEYRRLLEIINNGDDPREVEEIAEITED